MYKDSTWIHNKHTSSNFLSANRASVLICNFYHVPSGVFKLLLDLQARRTHSHLDKHSREDKRLFAWKCLCKIVPANSHFDEDSWSQTNYVVSLKIWAPKVEEMDINPIKYTKQVKYYIEKHHIEVSPTCIETNWPRPTRVELYRETYYNKLCIHRDRLP